MSFITWKNIFDDVFRECPEKWKLSAVHRNDETEECKLKNKQYFIREGFASFQCSKCFKYWASAKATVVLYFPKKGEAHGTVKARFFGQECKRCIGKKCQYADPVFEDVWIRSFLERFFEIIEICFYGKKKAKPVKSNYVKAPKTKEPKGPHEYELCEACRMGCCSQTLRTRAYKKQLF